jgi:predicted DNA-binding protein (UPF0278 family)
MNAQAQRVDVLAGMDTVDACLHSLRMDAEVKAMHINRFTEVRTAVAELIQRDKAQREALEICEQWFVKHSPTAPLIGGQGDAEHPMLTMIRAALAGGCDHG